MSESTKWTRDGETFRCHRKTPGYDRETDPWEQHCLERSGLGFNPIGVSIDFSKWAVDLALEDDPNLPVYSFNFGMRLLQCYVQSDVHHPSDVAYIEESIRAIQKAVRLALKDNPICAAYLSSLVQQFRRLDNSANVNEAIEAVQEALITASKDDPDWAAYLNNLESKLAQQDKRTDDIADLEDAIRAAQEAVALASNDNPDRAAYLDNLGSKLAQRYKLTDDIADLEDAIRAAQEVVALASNDNPDRAAYLDNLGSKLVQRYGRIGDIADLEGAIEAVKEAVTFPSEDSADRARYLDSLREVLQHKYDGTRPYPAVGGSTSNLLENRGAGGPGGPTSRAIANERGDWKDLVFDAAKDYEVQNPQRAENEAIIWFRRMRDVSNFLSVYRRTPVKESHLVKIAVLDTGIDLEHPVLQKYKAKDKKAQGQLSQEWCRDFVSDQVTIRDNNGHGTHCAHTILKVCSTARLYVARVLESNEADAGTAQRIIEAIEWAVECHVDIISMSFSLSRRHEKLRRAISSANGQHDILFFAAANNDGHYDEDPVGFPATMAHVVRINSCQYNGRQSEFSPNRNRNDANSLSTLGEKIEAAFPTALNGGAPLKCLTGTSMATAIMSGVAGLLIEFTKLSVGNSHETKVRALEAHLHTTEGIRAVMYHCMAGNDPALAPSYSYIRPWLLFQLPKTPEEVVRDIERALKIGL